MSKPFYPACENNKDPILAVLKRWLTTSMSLLEIGSGSGQHAVHFAGHLPLVNWQTSDLRENHQGIRQWLAEAQLANLMPPIELDVAVRPWPRKNLDAVFSANTFHIMSWSHVQALFAALPEVLNRDGLLLVYGAFNYNGTYTCDSNARFDQQLKQQDPNRGIRHFEEVNKLAEQAGLVLREDNAMPANNRLLVWEKTA